MNAKLLYSFLYLLLWALTSGCSDIKLSKAAPAIRSVQIKVAHYCPENARSLVNIFATNLSAATTEDDIVLDTDRDGLSDLFEQTVSLRDKYNLSYVAPDANGDGYTDLFAYNFGFDVERQATLAMCEDSDLDTDRDLLKDCEEDIVGTNPRDPDTDKDGIIDGLEFRFSLNAVDPLDSGLDHDGDGYNNLEEILNNGLIFTSEATQKLKHHIDYNVEAYLNEENKQCYEVLVSNIPLVNVNNGNMIKLVFLEMENVQGQEQVDFVRDVTVIASRGLASGHEIIVDEVLNQTIIENAQ